MKKLWFLVAFLLTLGIANVSFAAQPVLLSSKYGAELFAKKLDEQLVAMGHERNIRVISCNNIGASGSGQPIYRLKFNQVVDNGFIVFVDTTSNGYVRGIRFCLASDGREAFDQLMHILFASLYALDASYKEAVKLMDNLTDGKKISKDVVIGAPAWNEKNKRYYALVVTSGALGPVFILSAFVK